MTRAGLAIRAATRKDVPSLAGVLAANGEPGFAAGGEPPPYLTWLLGVGRVLIAERASAVVGWGAVTQAGPISHVADLFVHPSAHGQGIGQMLLAQLFGDSWPRTTFASADPRAMPVYVKSGMMPLWPSLYLTSEGGSGPRLRGTSLAVEPAGADECSAVELAATGRHRDPAPWIQGRPGSRLLIVRRADGSPAGFAMTAEAVATAGRTINRLVSMPDADPVELVMAILADEHDGRALLLPLPGPHPALRHLLDAGFRISDKDTFMASEPNLVDPTRHIVDPNLL
jgi:GNAT superfamily N-acetyltransferase